MASLVAQTVKFLHPWIRKIPWRRKWQPIPALLPGKFHGQRSLVSYSPRGRKELDTTERLHFTSLLVITTIVSDIVLVSGSGAVCLLPEFVILWQVNLFVCK